jgi:hypothetical protein
MTWKKVNNADAGTATKFGGNDLDKYSDYHSGVDVDDSDINSDTAYRYDKLQVRNAANTFGHKQRSLATAARTVTFPDGDITVGELDIFPYTWLVYKVGTTYKAKSGITGLTAYTGTTFKTNIWDNIKLSPSTKNHIHLLDGVYDIASGSTLDIPADDFQVSGETLWGTIIKPLGNNQVFSSSNRRRWGISDLTILVNQDATYTSHALRVDAAGGGNVDVYLKNLRIRHISTDELTRYQNGVGVAIVLSGANPAISYFDMENITVDAFEYAFFLSSSSPTGTPWMNDCRMTRCNSIHSKNFLTTNIPAAGQFFHWNFNDCYWQTTGSTGDATQAHMFDFSLTTCPHRSIMIKGCSMWDPANNTHKFFKANTNCRVMLVGGGAVPSGSSDQLGDQWMGGGGFDAVNGKWNAGALVTRLSSAAHTQGVSNIADGGTITHNLLATPKLVQVTPTVANELASVTAVGATTFSVAIKKRVDGTAGTAQNIYWTAYEYV